VAKNPRSEGNIRLVTLSALLFLWALAICGRLGYLQIVRYGHYAEMAHKEHERENSITPKRGIIYDRLGWELAMSVQVQSAFAVPGEVPDLDSTIPLITGITKEDAAPVVARCKASKKFCWVTRKIDAETAQRISDLHLKGIYLQEEPKRFYPKRELGAQVLGYVGMDDEGLSGIEREYDEELRGQPGEMSVSVDARRRDFSRVEKPPDPGANIVLTIDENIQYIAEREIEQAMEETHAIAATIVVENPHTGEILALANRPTFNPNRAKEIVPESLKNHAVSDVYEPGSTFKLVTVSAALNEGLTRPDEVFDCQMGSIVVGGMRIHDHKPFGLLPVSDIIAKSSDVGAIKIALRLGEERFYKYIQAYGLGQRTGIELPGETKGLLKPLQRWSKVSIGAISMGQEIGISPLQLAAMVSTIANDGMWVAPRIVAASALPQKAPLKVQFQPGPQHRVISTTTAAEMKQMMQGAVLHGTGTKAVLEGYSSAGKTGTAQKMDPATHAYSKTKYIGSFAGFAPVNDPAITVAVILDSAVGLHQGGQVAAPVFRRVSQQVLEYLHVPHDVELARSRQMLLASRKVKEDDLDEGTPEHPGAPLEVAEASAQPAATQVNVPPNAAPAGAKVVPAAVKTIESSPAAPVIAEETPPSPTNTAREKLPGGGVLIVSGEQGVEVPSFLGKSVRAAIETAADSGLELEAEGSGLGRVQNPPPGTRVLAGSRVVVRFGR
jgi:cell division protein FtsI (penicillin-binding protein 3)